MFIVSVAPVVALRQEGHVYSLSRSERPPSARRAMFIVLVAPVSRPPSGGPCALEKRSPQVRHGPPDGGWTLRATESINMALLTDGGPLDATELHHNSEVLALPSYFS